MRNGWAQWDGNMLVLDIQVQPSAAQIHVAGTHAGRLKVRLTAPPERGRANELLRQFLANEFGVPRTRVRLLTGTRGRAKRVHVEAPVRQPPWLANARDAACARKTGPAS